MRTSKFQLYQSPKDDQFYWRLLAKNSENILKSEGYQTKQGAENGIASVKKHAPFDERYKRLDAKNGEYYFLLTAPNNQVIGTSSETYTTKAARDKGIEAVKREAPVAIIEDLTEKDQQSKDEASDMGAAETGGGLTILPPSGNGKGITVKPKGGVYGDS